MAKAYINLTFEQEFSLVDYPATDYELRMVCSSAANSFEIPAQYITGDGAVWTVSVPADVTKDWAAGNYTATIIAKRLSDDAELPATSAALVVAALSGDQRSEARRTLDAINATLEGVAGSSVQKLSIAGRTMDRYSTDELLKLKATYQELVNREVRKVRGESPNKTIEFGFC